MTNKTTKIIAILFIIGCAIVYGVSARFGGNDSAHNSVKTTPMPISTQGEIVCLPHLDTNGPVTMECAYGLRDSDGFYYELKDENSSFQNSANVPMNTPVFVEGILQLMKSDTYNSIGVITISQITTQSTSPHLEDSGTAEIRIAETKAVGPVLITLHSVVQDNRCPVDVVCIEAGAITAHVTFKMGPNSETFNMPSDEVPHTFWGYKVSIIDVSPDALSKKTINPKDYKVAFRVEKI